MMLVEISPGVNSGLHTHPGFDAAYLLEGDLMVLERGQPEKAIHRGQSWHVRPDARSAPVDHQKEGALCGGRRP
jgi:quercetin dioxygenase-like cupin family protein